jgi:hypothetical protein
LGLKGRDNFMKTLGLTVSDETFRKFDAIQKKKGFRNQPECFEFVVDEVAKKEGVEA